MSLDKEALQISEDKENEWKEEKASHSAIRQFQSLEEDSPFQQNSKESSPNQLQNDNLVESIENVISQKEFNEDTTDLPGKQMQEQNWRQDTDLLSLNL